MINSFIFKESKVIIKKLFFYENILNQNKDMPDDISIEKNIPNYFNDVRLQRVIKSNNELTVNNEIYNYVYILMTKGYGYKTKEVEESLRLIMDERKNELDEYITKPCEHCLLRRDCFHRYKNIKCEDYKPSPIMKDRYYKEWPFIMGSSRYQPFN